jgi:hypothetical protein
MNGTLEVKRKAALMGAARKAHVIIDDRDAGSVGNGSTASFEVQPGHHKVAVRLGMTSGRPCRVDVAAGEKVRLLCRLRMGLWAASAFELTREDGAALDASAEPAPHHANLILILAILGFFLGLLGLAALGQGITDLIKMNKGQMDPSGRTLTLVGTILGGLGFLLNLIAVILFLAGGGVGG